MCYTDCWQFVCPPKRITTYSSKCCSPCFCCGCSCCFAIIWQMRLLLTLCCCSLLSTIAATVLVLCCAVFCVVQCLQRVSLLWCVSLWYLAALSCVRVSAAPLLLLCLVAIASCNFIWHSNSQVVRQSNGSSVASTVPPQCLKLWPPPYPSFLGFFCMLLAKLRRQFEQLKAQRRSIAAAVLAWPSA